VVVDQDKVVVSGDVVFVHGIVHHHNIRVVATRAEIVIVLFIGEKLSKYKLYRLIVHKEKRYTRVFIKKPAI